MTDMFDEEYVFPEELKLEGKKLVRETGAELFLFSLVCCGGFSAFLFGVNGSSFSTLIYVTAATAIWSMLCSLVIAFSKRFCRVVYKYCVLFGTLPFVGCFGWSIYKGKVFSLHFSVFGFRLNWFESVLLIIVIFIAVLQYLKTVFVTYFKLYESEITDAYIGKRTSQSMI